MEASTHSAPGPMAGFLFQPERALYWLAKSQRGDVVGVETGDDVVLKSANGITTHEQAKSTIADKATTLSDRSTALWKTLSIWIQAIKSGAIDIFHARFVIATTATLPPCLTTSLGKEDKSKAEVAACIAQLRATGSQPSATLAPYASQVLECNDQDLGDLISRVCLIDGSDGSCGPALRAKLVSELHIPSQFPEEAILQSLYGWVCSTLLDLWRSGKPGWIPQESFVRAFHQVIRLHDRSAFRERAKDLLPVTDDDRKSNRGRPFVQQILLVLPEVDEDFLISAIDDFVRSLNERSRLSQQGNITREELEAFDGRLCDRWKLIFHRNTYKKGKDESEARDHGYKVLADTLDFREQLAGQPTEEYYLTRGSYHKLADLVRIGWHPNFKSRMQETTSK